MRREERRGSWALTSKGGGQDALADAAAPAAGMAEMLVDCVMAWLD